MNPLNYQLKKAKELDDHRDKKHPELFEHLPDVESVFMSGDFSDAELLKEFNRRKRRREADELMEDDE